MRSEGSAAISVTVACKYVLLSSCASGVDEFVSKIWYHHHKQRGCQSSPTAQQHVHFCTQARHIHNTPDKYVSTYVEAQYQKVTHLSCEQGFMCVGPRESERPVVVESNVKISL